MRARRSLFGLLVLTTLCGIIYWLVPLHHFDFVKGTYAYDPRSDAPSALILANRPETFVVQLLIGKIQNGEPFPSKALQNVVSIEPTQVVVFFYTDWYAFAHVTIKFTYSDSTTNNEVFRLKAPSSTIVPLLVVDLSLGNEFQPLRDCFLESASTFYCPFPSEITNPP